jgi:ATP-dependent protease ClpP protease subunit
MTLMALIGSSLYGKAKSVTVNLDSAVIISGPIFPESMKNRIKELIDLQKNPEVQSVDIVLNSPGGEVYSTLMFISVMEQIKASGKEVRCVVLNGAASAAFQILSHCSQRVSMEHSFLLWHPVRIGLGFGASLTPTEAVSLANHLVYLEDILIKDLRQTLKVSDEDFWKHYTLETLHTGASLHELDKSFLDIVGFVTNLKEVREKAEEQEKKDASVGGIFGMSISPEDFIFDYSTPIYIPDLIQ